MTNMRNISLVSFHISFELISDAHFCISKTFLTLTAARELPACLPHLSYGAAIIEVVRLLQSWTVRLERVDVGGGRHRPVGPSV